MVCSNCRLPSGDSPLCELCIDRRECPRCRRRLDDKSFRPGHRDFCEACWKKLHRANRAKSFHSVLTELDIPVLCQSTDIRTFINSSARQIESAINESAARHMAIKWFVTAHVEFVRETDLGLQSSDAYFRSSPSTDIYFDETDLIQNLEAQVGNFNERSSSWRLARILEFTVSTGAYRPLAAATWFPTPKYLELKHCIRNIKNTDNMCFVWCVLAALHYKAKNYEHVSNYRRYQNEINLRGLVFPMQIRHIPKFELQNEDIAINVFCLEGKQIIPLYVSKHTDRRHHVSLLLLTSGRTRRYVLITRMSALTADRSKSTRRNYVCDHCI